MASSIIHICVAKEINKIIKRNSDNLYIGTIAPDISKLVGLPKRQSHFVSDLEETENLPDLNKFLIRYKDNLNDDFVLGYYIHLYTDYLWFKYFLTEIMDKNFVTKLDGTTVNVKGSMQIYYIYNDYTNMNEQLLDLYNLDCKIFYNELPKFNNIIKEIPMDKINLIVNEVGLILEKTKQKKDLIFNIDQVQKFIETSTKIILSDLKEKGIC